MTTKLSMQKTPLPNLQMTQQSVVWSSIIMRCHTGITAKSGSSELSYPQHPENEGDCGVFRRPERPRAANPQLHNSGESSNITEALPWSNHTSADICKAHLYFYLPWGESDCCNTSSAFTDILQTVLSLASQLWYGMTAEVNSNTRQTDVERTAENSRHWPINASCWRQQWSRW